MVTMMDPAGPQQPGSRQPAPGDLRLVQGFLNTVDIEGREETFTDPERLASWLVEHGLLEPGTRLGEGDLRLAVAFREGLRDLAHANHERRADPAAVSAINRIAAAARLRVRFEEDGGARLEPDAPGIDGAVAHLLAIVYAAVEEGTWVRFKACRNQGCRWAFYDRSRNRSSSWCSMAVCGNREKARAYRRRRGGGGE